MRLKEDRRGWTMSRHHGYCMVAWTRMTGSCLLLSLSLIVIQGRGDVELAKDDRYEWKTGQWGRCMGDDCGPGGVQTRSVWCVHAEGWAAAVSSCPLADMPQQQRRCFRECDLQRELFEWETSEWGTCTLTPGGPQPAECVMAQHGVQWRSVRCMRTSDRSAVTERVCEFLSRRPAEEQACLIPCPRPCIVSDFSTWSACSASCGVGLQHRTRAVLAAPVYGGASCPNLTQTRPCEHLRPCPGSEGEFRYSLKVGPWTECRLPHHKEMWLSGRTTLDFSTDSGERNSVQRQVRSTHHTPHHHRHHQRHLSPKVLDIEIGYQTRQVRCMRSDGKNSMLSLCTQDSIPVTFQSCVMPRDCETSEWGPWNPCSKSCRALDLSPGYRTRTRSLKQVPIGGGEECPGLEDKEACNIIGDLLPECPRYVWKNTDWGECQIQPLLSTHDRRHGNLSLLCGGGIQTRETYCVQVPGDAKEVTRPVNKRLCPAKTPPAVQPCSIPCPQDCLLSPWSPWGSCLYDDCLDPQGRKGFRQRARHVLREPAGMTQDCPHLVESMACEDPVCFHWLVSSTQPCEAADGRCGAGSQAQIVLCVDSEGEAVPSERCQDDPPPSLGPCEVPCPGDCVPGAWSSWSPCSHSCSSRNSEGRQSRTRTVLAPPGQGGKHCPPASTLEDWRPCNQHPCIVFYWEASPWGPCTEEPSASDPNVTSSSDRSSTCAVGIQTRKVSCMKINVGPVVPKRCPESSRPDATRPCLLPCRRDCIVTAFSEWTSCPSGCQPVNSTMTTQSRYRIIMQKSTNGGQECPDTLHEERECESLPVCPTYRWKIHKWHQCTLVPDSVQQGLTGVGESCGRGLEIRGVACVGEDEELANVTECLQWAGAMPPRARPCWVPCKDDCTLSSWSKFTDCADCGGWRTRKRTLTGRSKKQPKCQRSELYPLVETEPCPCTDFRAQPRGNWSSCVLPESRGWRAQRELHECGQGLRHRAVACTDRDGRLVDPALCGGSGYVEEVCLIPCPLDCKLSDWSAWSACSAPCGSGVKVRSKWLREKPFNGGRPCPKLDLKNQVYEAVPCYSECSQYTWAPEPWSACAVNMVDTPSSCGEGVQSRKVRCVRKDTVGDAVDSSLCDPEEAPPSGQTCFVPCPEDCVMSQWSQWSSCPSPCEQSVVRTRQRQTLRLPQTGSTCPEESQADRCVLNSTCFNYHYNLSDWSTCLLSESAICGQGVKVRQLDCVRSDGAVLELSVCEELLLPAEWQLTMACVVDCPVNCLLSEWTPWSSCSITCGFQGQMVRSRGVMQQAHEQGRPCPSQLSQTKPCPIRPCYTWLLGDWSSCWVEGAQCGEGVRERNLTCVVHGGDLLDVSSARAVGAEKCEDRLRGAEGRELQLPCSVPCPGDCHLTEWSSWSCCQLTCLNGRSFETTGQQARSRAVVIQVPENQDSCPQQVFETRPCKDGRCHSYEWRTSGWKGNERSVWCQRSDGVNVTGGCVPQEMPTTIRHCYPPCTKPFSHCTQRGVCGCEAGYTEVMTAHGFLDYCTRTPGLDNNKADVKINSGRFKPGTSQIQEFFHEWSLKPVGPDGRVKMWVYGLTAGGFALIVLVIALSFLLCKTPVQSKSSSPPQKPLTLAYDGDVDM
ncbi:thrombospondin type-1 domain-containing protein 7B-like isoform X1 [Paramormyrops kingsleyae]|uniref:thrombospondin type-1 domain-containing protein 7B-like isoform X1 n=2 Tax=Paramormyrops kingsleyae TaxID=1676925 RepID=UPI003B96FA0B